MSCEKSTPPTTSLPTPLLASWREGTRGEAPPDGWGTKGVSDPL